MTDIELTTLIRSTATEMAFAGTDTARALATRMRAAGVIRNLHVGLQPLGARQTLEWYAGQFLEIVETGAWFAMNSWLNCVDKFAPTLEEK